MGSEFAYEDLGSQEIEKYTYTYLKDEAIDGRAHWVMEMVPTDRKSGYSKQVSWVDQAYRQPTKIDSYDRKGAHLKTFTFTGYQQFGKWWRATEIAALNHQTKKQSKLTWTDRKLGEAADEDAALGQHVLFQRTEQVPAPLERRGHRVEPLVASESALVQLDRHLGKGPVAQVARRQDDGERVSPDCLEDIRQGRVIEANG